MHQLKTVVNHMMWTIWRSCSCISVTSKVSSGDLESHHVSTQLNTYGRFRTIVLDTALHHRQGISFERKAFHPSSRDPQTHRINGKTHWSSSSSMWRPNTLLKHFRLVFPCRFFVCVSICVCVEVGCLDVSLTVLKPVRGMCLYWARYHSDT